MKSTRFAGAMRIALLIRTCGSSPLSQPVYTVAVLTPKTYKGLSYVITTFRLKKRTIAEADVIEDALALGSRTNALQFAVEQVFNDLHKRSRSMTRAEIDRDMRRRLKKLGS